jgi:hypothetical protein
MMLRKLEADLRDVFDKVLMPCVRLLSAVCACAVLIFVDVVTSSTTLNQA